VIGLAKRGLDRDVPPLGGRHTPSHDVAAACVGNQRRQPPELRPGETRGKVDPNHWYAMD
jgi:hypothetical protein